MTEEREASRQGLSMKGFLVLEDGEVYVGTTIGAPNDAWGEVVFHTAVTGYQDILTDPAYRGQIVVLTYPPWSAIMGLIPPNWWKTAPCAAA